MTDNFIAKLCKYIKSSWRELLTIVVVALADLISKNIVQAAMTIGQDIVLIPGLLHFTYVLNTKAAYGSAFGLEKLFGEDGVITFFIVLTIVALIIFGYLLWRFKNRNLLARISFALIIGGAFGNLVDRMVLRAVRDFIRLELFGVSVFGCFNIADMALVIGVILFALYFIFFFDKDEKRLEKQNSVPAQPGACDAVKSIGSDGAAAEADNNAAVGEELKAVGFSDLSDAVKTEAEPDKNDDTDR